jgi:uncharacterized protein YecT (DUF1311 family)
MKSLRWVIGGLLATSFVVPLAVAAQGDNACPMGSQSMVELSNCIYREYKGTDSTLEKTWRRVLPHLDGATRLSVQASQRAWLIARESAISLSRYPGNHPEQDAYSAGAEITRERIVYLHSLLRSVVTSATETVETPKRRSTTRFQDSGFTSGVGVPWSRHELGLCRDYRVLMMMTNTLIANVQQHQFGADFMSEHIGFTPPLWYAQEHRSCEYTVRFLGGQSISGGSVVDAEGTHYDLAFVRCPETVPGASHLTRDLYCVVNRVEELSPATPDRDRRMIDLTDLPSP